MNFGLQNSLDLFDTKLFSQTKKVIPGTWDRLDKVALAPLTYREPAFLCPKCVNDGRSQVRHHLSADEDQDMTALLSSLSPSIRPFEQQIDEVRGTNHRHDHSGRDPLRVDHVSSDGIRHQQ